MDMRISEEILKKQEVHQINIGGVVYEMVKFNQAVKAINEARKEAMNDVAKKILETNIYNGGNTIVNDRVRDKIDSLIEQVK